jgi:hypothetical protein
MKFKVRNEEALTCLADARLSSPEGRGMSWLTCLADARLSSPEGRGIAWHTCLANVSASDTPLFKQPSPIRDARTGMCVWAANPGCAHFSESRACWVAATYGPPNLMA